MRRKERSQGERKKRKISEQERRGTYRSGELKRASVNEKRIPRWFSCKIDFEYVVSKMVLQDLFLKSCNYLQKCHYVF